MSVIEYHNSPTDPFNTTECENRENNYYGYSGHPNMWFDGVLSELGGTNYRPKFDTRKNIAAPITIELSGTYDSTSRQGTINAHITNTTGSTIGGALRFVLTETNIAYAWLGEDSLFFVARDMLPNENGETVVLNAGDTLNKSQNYTVNSAWNAKNCDIIVFVQGSSHEIYQGAKLKVVKPAVEEGSTNLAEKAELKISPNPFLNSTVINYQLPVKGEVSLKLYDGTGRLIKTLLNEEKQAGNYSLTMDSNNLKTGIYFVRLKAGNYTISEKITKTR